MRVCHLSHRRARHTAVGSKRHKNMLAPVTKAHSRKRATPLGLHVSSLQYRLAPTEVGTEEVSMSPKPVLSPLSGGHGK